MEYLKKHGWLPLVTMLIPAVIACFLSTPYWEVAFVSDFGTPYLSASKTFAVMFGDSWQYIWPVILIAVFQVLAAAIVMSAMDLHFRTGRLSIKAPHKLINNSIFPIAICVAIMSAAGIILRFLLFGLVSLVQVIGEAASFSEGATLTLISVVAVGMFILHVLLITPMLFWEPIVFIYGYRFRDAAATSFKLLSGKRIFVGLFLPMVVCAGLQLLVGFLNAHAAIVYMVGFLVFLFTNMYTTVYTMLTFYDISDLERRDIKPYEAALPQRQTPKAETSSPEQNAAESAEAQKSGARSGAKTKQNPKSNTKSGSVKNKKGSVSGVKNKSKNGEADNGV